MTGDLPGGYTVVVGTDLERDQAAIRQLVSIEVIVGLIVLTILGAAGYVLVRNSLRPLAEVEAHGPRDRRRRPVPARAGGQRAHRGRPAGHLAQRDAVPDRERLPRPAGLRGAGPRLGDTGCAASSPTPATNCGRR